MASNGSPDLLSKSPRLIILAGPSGVGKGTLISQLIHDHPDRYSHSVSHTTRKPRKNEVDGVHYHFTTHEKMHQLIDQGYFVEYASVHDQLYGTSFSAVKNVIDAGKECLLDIDVQGCIRIKEKAQFNFIMIFVFPPSMDVLKQRLIQRGTETEESIVRRMQTAKDELAHSRLVGFWDHVIVNEHFDKTLGYLKEVIQNE